MTAEGYATKLGEMSIAEVVIPVHIFDSPDWLRS